MTGICQRRAICNQGIMRSLRRLLTIAAVSCALTVSAKANLIFMGAVNFHNGPDDPAANALAATRFLRTNAPYILLFGGLIDNFETDLSGPVTAAVNWFEFFVVHYSQGQDGAGAGGSLEFFWKPVGETSVTFPQIGGGPSNPDRFGHGGIVSARGFNVAIVEPDAGAAAMLLSIAVCGLGFVRRLAA
jgi:hypothetical protein